MSCYEPVASAAAVASISHVERVLLSGFKTSNCCAFKPLLDRAEVGDMVSSLQGVSKRRACCWRHCGLYDGFA